MAKSHEIQIASTLISFRTPADFVLVPLKASGQDLPLYQASELMHGGLQGELLPTVAFDGIGRQKSAVGTLELGNIAAVFLARRWIIRSLGISGSRSFAYGAQDIQDSRDGHNGAVLLNWAGGAVFGHNIEVCLQFVQVLGHPCP